MARSSVSVSTQGVATDETGNLIAASKVNGTYVYNRQGDSLGSIYDVIAVEPFTHGAFKGVALTADNRGGELLNFYIRRLFIFFQSRSGETSIVCSEEKSRFDARRSEFEAVARGVRPPS